MNSRHRVIRANLSAMSSERAADYIRAFRLTEREEACIVEKEVNGLSYTEIGRKYGLSSEAIRDARRKAFSKIADAIAYRQEKSRG